MGLFLDKKLTFKEYIKDTLNKVYFGVSNVKRRRDILPRDSLVTIYKSFIRPHLDYGDVIYDQPNNDSFIDKIEQLQYKACLTTTGAIQRTSRECLCSVLGLENLSSRRWGRKLFAIYKLLSTQCPKYLFDIIPFSVSFYDTRKKQRPFFNCRTDCFKYSFSPNSFSESSQLAPEIQISKSLFLRLRFSHLNEHKFSPGLQDTLNPLCNCSLETEDFFVCCLNL